MSLDDFTRPGKQRNEGPQNFDLQTGTKGSEESRQTGRKRRPTFPSKHLRAVTLLSLWVFSFWAEEEEEAAHHCLELSWGPEEKCRIGRHFSFADKL